MLLAFQMGSPIFWAAIAVAAVAYAAYRHLNPPDAAGVALLDDVAALAPMTASAAPIQQTAIDLAQETHKVNLGFLTRLFRAIGANDLASLKDEIAYIGRLVSDGTSFTQLMEQFVFDQLEAFLRDPLRRDRVLSLVTTVLGLKLAPASPAAANPPAATPPAAPAPAAPAPAAAAPPKAA
jgi:hypothetical protein